MRFVTLRREPGLLLVRVAGFDPSDPTLYFDTIVGGPGVTSASGPLGSTWQMITTQGFSNQDYLGFFSVALPSVEIDAIGLNYPDGIPRSIGPVPDAFFYLGCLDGSTEAECPYFGSDTTGIETIFVKQVSEPDSLLLLTMAGFGIFLTALLKRFSPWRILSW
jgi:hypothetical protein